MPIPFIIAGALAGAAGVLLDDVLSPDPISKFSACKTELHDIMYDEAFDDFYEIVDDLTF